MSTAPALSPGRVTDIHAHVQLPDIDKMVSARPEAAAYGATLLDSLGRASAEENQQMTLARWGALVDIAERLRIMDQTSVDTQLVSVSPSQYHPWADRGLALDLTLAINEGVAAHCALAPTRLAGLGVVPLQHPELAVEALEHAVSVCGHRGVEVSTYALDPGGTRVVELSDPRLESFWARACELSATVFIHPFGCTVGSRLDQWYLSNTVGQPLEHAIALSHLIFSGVFDRHPTLRLLAAHGGGYLPGYLGRSDHAWRARSDAHSCARLPSSYLDNVLVDSLVLDPTELHVLVDRMGVRNVLLGSDYPYDMSDATPTETLLAAGLDPAETRAVAGGNAARLGLTPLELSPQGGVGTSPRQHQGGWRG